MRYTEDEKDLIISRLKEGKSYKEISEETGRSVKSLYSKSFRKVMYNDDIEYLKTVKTQKDLLKKYPKCKEISNRTYCTFYEIYDKHFVKFYHYHKDGRSMYNVTSYKLEDVDFTKIELRGFYRGNHPNFKDIPLS